jgi:hypothetical protein
LHVTKEISAFCEGCLFVVREIAYPVASTFTALILRRPSIPCSTTLIFLDQNTEKRVIVQPRGFFFTEVFEFKPPFFVGASGEVRKRLLENALL